ncbi:Hypothetical_protein [Hexamita inflata]|uniref:Hypothetical_protein n=1 Tax=Hexamita inflata TaxID=28002 RepID=A0AA86QQ76_9EUKA|nr:Hypothetical protein HINF_LOCUS49828 [Hexamita inflata]
MSCACKSSYSFFSIILRECVSAPIQLVSQIFGWISVFLQFIQFILFRNQFENDLKRFILLFVKSILTVSSVFTLSTTIPQQVFAVQIVLSDLIINLIYKLKMQTIEKTIYAGIIVLCVSGILMYYFSTVIMYNEHIETFADCKERNFDWKISGQVTGSIVILCRILELILNISLHNIRQEITQVMIEMSQILVSVLDGAGNDNFVSQGVLIAGSAVGAVAHCVFCIQKIQKIQSITKKELIEMC